MANYRTSRVIPTVLTIIVIIVAIAGFVALARLIFGGGAGDDKPLDTSRQNLLDSSVGRGVSMTVRGPIVANEDFRSYKIFVSPTTREFKSYTGYLTNVTGEETLTNNTAAYEQFTGALDKANLIVGQPFEGEKNDVRGICATGKVYEFSLHYETSAVETLWTSTCSGSPGSLKASVTQLSQLFLNQIPDGSNIESSLKL